jgi:hypothetical protein
MTHMLLKFSRHLNCLNNMSLYKSLDTVKSNHIQNGFLRSTNIGYNKCNTKIGLSGGTHIGL